MDQKNIIERVIIDRVCSSGCPVNSFTDISFIIVVYWENAFGAAVEFLAAIQCKWPLSKIGSKALVVSRF